MTKRINTTSTPTTKPIAPAQDRGSSRHRHTSGQVRFEDAIGPSRQIVNHNSEP
jgi:hypothetical protein